jgi:hypothetical protein
MPDSAPGLSVLQLRVLRIVRDVPAAQGFVLAGGGAMLAHGLVSRPTDDLDLFTTEPRDLPLVSAQAQKALGREGLEVEVVRSGAGFIRMRVTEPASGDQTLLDLAWDARLEPPQETPLGPILSVRELAADKVLALFGRAEARDLVDVRALVDVLGEEAVLRAAAEKDPGFDGYVFAQMLAMTHDRPDADFPVAGADLAELRSWAQGWRVRLAAAALGEQSD